MSRWYYSLVVTIFLHPCLMADEPFFLKNGDRVLFLGDSNTYSGQFIAYLDAFLLSRFPEKKFELINLGLPSETISGLSEPDHPFPRPNVQDRVVKALKETKPTVVVVSYGMNDGIYYPFAEDRFQKYKQGIRKMIDLVKKQKARLVFLTPSPFDPLPLKAKVLPANAKKFSWVTPYAEYDDVLGKYSQWLVGLNGPEIRVVDVHSAVNTHLRQLRKTMPNYFLAGDGIHPNPRGHWIVAAEILKAWHAPAIKNHLFIKLEGDKLGKMGNTLAKVQIKDKSILIQWKIPTVVKPDSAVAKIWPEFQVKLVLEGVKTEQWKMKVNGSPGDILSREMLAQGIDLTKLLVKMETNRSDEILAKVEKRQNLLGRAWLSHVGHNRPGTPKGLPLEQARKEAAALEQEIREMIGSLTLEIQLIPKSLE